MADGKFIDGKVKRLTEISATLADLQAKMEGDEAENNEENRKTFDDLHAEALGIKSDITRGNNLNELNSFLNDPVNGSKVFGRGGDGANAQPFTAAKSIGEQFIDNEAYKRSVEGGKVVPNLQAGIDLKGFLDRRLQKATFDTTSGGLDTSRMYIARPVELIQQQRLTVRDLLSVGETTQSIIYFIKESSFTNAADMVAEEGEKPEATLATTSASAPVRKIAVVLKVTEEMFADFPQLRDYINTRLTFMVQQKEEDQLLNGTGSGNQITGILQTSGIQTQAKGGDTNLDAIHKAITKIRTPTTGGYEPDGIVMHPTDYQLIRLAKDGANQYFGGGPFTYGPYGNGGYQDMPGPWGLRPVVTTAITAGTALVGAFKMAAQIWQREGIRVESTNSNEDDFNFNRVSLRVEERLALAVYAPGAFCTVTSIA
jgi:HK97 family phage major capsid protein